MEKSDHGESQTAWICEKDQLQYLVNIKYILKIFWFPTTQL